MFKMAQNTLSSWAITGLTIILLLGAIYQVYTWGSAATTTKRSGHTVVVVVQVQMQNGTGLKKRFSRSVFYWAGLLACLLACATIRTRTCLDYRLLSWLPDPMIDWLLSRVHVHAHVPHDHHARSIDRRLSTNTRTRARAPWKRKMKMNPAGQARSGQVMLYSAPCCTRHLLVCLLFALFLLLPVYRVCTLTLVYGRYDANYVLCTPYSSAYACMCVYRYLNWTGN